MIIVESAPSWFVLHIRFCRELKVRDLLLAAGMEAFVPMRCQMVIKEGRRSRVEAPAVHNLIFVRATQAELDAFVSEYRSHYSVRYLNAPGQNTPVIISNCEMRHFISVAGTPSENLLYLDDNFETFSEYDKVRVCAGLFEGLEGHLVRIRRDRKVVFRLHGVLAVAITGIDRSLLEKIG